MHRTTKAFRVVSGSNALNYYDSRVEALEYIGELYVESKIVGELEYYDKELDDYVGRPKQLVQPGDANTKLRKNGAGFQTIGLSLSPHKSAGVGNTCPHASAGCMAACLDHQGMASVFATIQDARRKKTRLFYSDRDTFMSILENDIARAKRKADKAGMRLAVRLNVFSDIPWETTGIVDKFRDVQFYDYTKNPRRAGLLRPNYWVTFSRSEVNDTDCQRLLSEGKNVAVVFANSQAYVGNRSHMQTLPRKLWGYDVVDGDVSDLRFEDTRGRKYGRIVGLRLKTHSHAEREAAIASGFPIVV